MIESSVAPLAPLTTRTRVSLAIARALAAAHGHDDLSPAHVLLGMLREGENPAVAVLAHAGVSLTELRQRLERALEARGRRRLPDLLLPFTDGERQLLARADGERTQRGNQPLGTEHLLLAILRDLDADVCQELARHGRTYDSAAAHVAAVVHYHTSLHAPSTG